MELATSLLEWSNDSMAEIGSRVGYETMSAFRSCSVEITLYRPAASERRGKKPERANGAVPAPL
jgi:transcriptional regulator GlxA family with amidase domain